MKVSYFLECYDVLLRLVNALTLFSNNDIIHELAKNEKESYRVYEVAIIKNDDEVKIKVSKPKHSFHPSVIKMELKSVFQFHEFEKYIPILRKQINFTGENILLAADLKNENIFYVYEKCSIYELSPNERLFLFCNQTLEQENQNIKLAFKEKIFNLNSKLKIEHFIQKNQLAIENHLIKIIKLINPESNKEVYHYSDNYTKTDCLKCIYTNLEKLLVFIEKEYNDYLNENIMVPVRTMLMKEYDIKPKLDFVRDSLLSMEMDQELLKILFEPILQLSTINIQNKITYYQFNYAWEYVSELAQLIEMNQSEMSNAMLSSWLVDLNCNSFRFFDYITNQLKIEIENCPSDYEKLELLYKKLKKYNQHRNKIKKSFNSLLPTIKEQTCSWLEEEIEFINRKINLDNLFSTTPKTGENNPKILMGLSVAQIGYFINILVQAGIIKHTNQREIFRMVADNFKTNVTENISIDSLSSKYYNVESSTKNAIKEKIIELLNLTK